MPHFDLVIRARRAVVDGIIQQAAIGIANGAIVAVHTGSSARSLGVVGDHLLVLDDDVVLLPGIVDPHVTIGHPGAREWEGFGPVTEAAYRGGVTSILDNPLGSQPHVTSPAIHAELAHEATGYSFADFGFWGLVSPDTIGNLSQLWDDGVFGFACALTAEQGAASGPSPTPIVPADRLLDVMTEIESFDGLLAVDTGDDPQLVDHVLDGVRQSGCRVHLLRFSAAESLAKIRTIRREGHRVTVEVCAHILSLSTEKLGAGPQVAERWIPPVRDAAHRELLWEGLRDGTVDCVVSGHHPERTASVQLSLPITWSEARLRGFGLADVVRWMSQAPASIVGLHDRGSIRQGAHADFAVLADDKAFVVLPEKLQHTDPQSAFVGRPLAGVVRDCILDGKIVGSRLLPRGAWLRRTDDKRSPIL